VVGTPRPLQDQPLVGTAPSSSASVVTRHRMFVADGTGLVDRGVRCSPGVQLRVRLGTARAIEDQPLPRGPQPPEGLPPGMYVTLSGGSWSNAASFRLRGSRLDPDVVTRAIGVEPSRAAKRGEARASAPTRTNRTGAWALESDDACSRADDHLEKHLRWLLDHLEPRADQLADVVAKQGLEAEFWCVVQMEGANCDFELQPETIARMAALGATLRLDIYAPDHPEPEVIEIPEPSAEPEARGTG
jgi:Domain of unknown function (DUF4279)